MILVIFLSVFFLPFAHLKTISQKDWVGQNVTRRSSMIVPVEYFVIHHTDSRRCFTERVCSGIVRAIQKDHMKSRGWSDIGYKRDFIQFAKFSADVLLNYSFLVGEDGNVYEGRGWTTVGAHAPRYNTKSIGLSFIGTFSNEKPNGKALTAAKELISYAINQRMLETEYKLIGHRQTKNKTECPGDALYLEISTWPNWAKKP